MTTSRMRRSALAIVGAISLSALLVLLSAGCGSTDQAASDSSAADGTASDETTTSRGSGDTSSDAPSLLMSTGAMSASFEVTDQQGGYTLELGGVDG